MTNTTMVTAFFDINRETKGDGRKLDDYLNWIKKTLQLNCNLFIVTEEKFVDFMKQHRPKEYTTYIKVDTLENAQYYKYREQMIKILESEDYKKKIKHPNRVECKLPEYNIIQYSKFGWLKDAININPFQSEYFFWMDIGISRFFLDVDIKKPFPNNKNIIKAENKFIIQCRQDIHNYPYNEDYFIWDSANLLIGGIFGGYKEIVLNIDNKLEQIFNKSMLEKDNVNNEQLGLLIVYKKNPELFNLINSIQGYPFILFKYLSL